MAKSLSTRAKEERLQGKLISISIRYSDFSNMVRSVSLQHYTNDVNVLMNPALYLFDHNYSGAPIRHLGDWAGIISSAKSVHQINMFQEPIENTNKVDLVLEELNKQLPNANLTTLGRMKKS